MAVGAQIGWTEQERAKLRELWNMGLSSGVIATRLGRSRGAIMGQVNKLGLFKREKPTREQTMDAFAECLADGLSIADASRRLGLTKTYGFDIFKAIRDGLGWQAI